MLDTLYTYSLYFICEIYVELILNFKRAKMSEELGMNLYFKLELQQATGSFKGMVQ